MRWAGMFLMLGILAGIGIGIALEPWRQFGALVWLKKVFWTQEAAGWAQAFGALVAIAIGFHQARQARAEAKRDKDAEHALRARAVATRYRELFTKLAHQVAELQPFIANKSPERLAMYMDQIPESDFRKFANSILQNHDDMLIFGKEFWEYFHIIIEALQDETFDARQVASLFHAARFDTNSPDHGHYVEEAKNRGKTYYDQCVKLWSAANRMHEIFASALAG